MRNIKSRLQSMLLAILLVTGGVATVGTPPAHAILGSIVGVGSKIIGGIVQAGEKATMLAVVKEILSGTTSMRDLSGDIKSINSAMGGNVKSLFDVTQGYYNDLMTISSTVRGLEELIGLTRDIRDVYGYSSATIQLLNRGQHISLDQHIYIIERNIYLLDRLQNRVVRLYKAVKTDNELKLSDYERLTMFNQLSAEVAQLKVEARDMVGTVKGYELLGEQAKKDEQFRKDFFSLSL